MEHFCGYLKTVNWSQCEHSKQKRTSVTVKKNVIKIPPASKMNGRTKT